jgi:predicted lipid-binding transport protein (Tim44 family)
MHGVLSRFIENWHRRRYLEGNGEAAMMLSARKMLTALAAAVIAAGITATLVEAKPGRGGGVGNRGARTDMTVPSTPTAPRTTTPQAAPNTASQPARPAAPTAAQAAQAAKPSMMSTMAKGFAAGLIGAGLFGLLTGSGLFGGLSGVMGFLGLLLQVALIALAARLIWGFLRNRQQQTQLRTAGAPDLARAGIGQQPAPSAPQPAAYQPQPVEPHRSDTVGIGPDDYTAFQGVLNDLMASYSNEDLAGLRRVTTPDVAAHFIRELHENQSKGVVNRLGEPTLLQGDLAEAWYEDNVAFATVAMRYALVDVMLERTSGKVIAGDPQQPAETTEIWTFRRDGAGRPWLLCGQQQA